MTSRFAKLQHWTATFLTVYVAVSICLRLSLKDRLPLLSTAYYASPLPLVTFALIVAGIVWMRLQFQKRAVANLLMAIVCLGWTVRQTYVANSQTPAATDLSVLLWNASSCDFGWNGVVETLRAADPDIIALVESGSTDADALHHWAEAFPEYDVSTIAGDMLVFSRSKIVRDDFGSLGNGGRFKHVTVETDDGVMHLFVVDINSNPLMHRRATLEQLADVAKAIENEPVLLLGDFNTPADSIHFASLRETFTNAFETSGNGYAPTWPIAAPVLQLDHIWGNERVAISSCSAGWTIRSDHRPVTACVRVKR